MGRKRKPVMTQDEAMLAVRVFDSAPIHGGGQEYREIREPVLRKLNAIATGELIVVEAPKPKKEAPDGEQESDNSED